LTVVIIFIIILGAFFIFSNPLQYKNAIATANSATVGIEVGNLAPDFKLVDVEQKTITRSSLQGKPTMIIFTTTWCVPCQIGARELLKYDLETGDRAFNVLVVFIDPRETSEQIKQWKNRFGGKDWFTALDTTGMTYEYQVKYLDTKYVLDKNGITVWKDFFPLNYETAKKVLGPLISR
jgi:cytochrome oxidase Cu insertion factor (SCO1/SenC/PrrC family)